MAALATLVDFIHALLIVVWVGGLPLLFWRHFPGVSRAYAVYAAAFVIVNLLSSWLIGECPLTILARLLWVRAPTRPPHTNEWFTVRFAELVFSLSPSHRSIKLITKALILASAVGVLYPRRGRLSGPSVSRA